MSSSDPKPEPLFVEAIDDPSVRPDEYDPNLKFTVLDHINPESQVARGTLQYGTAQAPVPTKGPEPIFTSSAEDPALKAVEDAHDTFLDSVNDPAAFEETAMAKNQKGEVETPEMPTRTTILPKAIMTGEEPSLHLLSRERYEQLRDLGEGAAGDVLLARDNDIQRLVALKRLKKKHHVPMTLARFVEEIQTVGQLEHPHIVPIHDVGVDENGLYYFVMKYVEGDTMASIIEKLKAGDEEAHKQFPFEVRNQIFLKVLQAVQFAHKSGIIHRDLKPENIMVGAYGQVMVMDWGIAKRISTGYFSHQEQLIPTNKENLEGAINEASKAALPEGSLQGGDTQKRIFETQVGTIMGTPAYMAPEQALGRIDQLDVRSDIYSLSALYYEWMTLKHYLSHKTNIKELMWGILQEEPPLAIFVESPHQPTVPTEFGYFVRKGLRKEPAERYQDIAEMEHTLQLAIAGKFGVHCPITLMKRSGNETLRFIDRFPTLSMIGVGIGVLLALLGTMQVGFWVYQLIT